MFSKKNILQIFVALLSLSSFLELSAQTDSDKASTRFFMPSLQVGYIGHNSSIITRGLLFQTSLEYRAKNNLLYRINYDDFSGRITIKDSDNNEYGAKIPLSDLIGGIGYRFSLKKHNLFALIQAGVRFYELPDLEEVNGIISINQIRRHIVPIRYTMGYEYEFMKNVFLNVEVFLGHFAKEKDYWSNKKPFFGCTVGLSTTLF